MSNSEEKKSSSSSKGEEKTFDVRDLVNKSGYQKNPREIIENPAVTPQMPEESDDSQAGFEERTSDDS